MWKLPLFPLLQETQNSTLGSHKKRRKKKPVKERKGKKLQLKAKEKINKTFNSTVKERSAATFCLSPLLPLHKSHRSSARSLACALSLLHPWSTTTPPFCWDPTSTYYYVHAIESSD
jgi:hypothetical protein